MTYSHRFQSQSDDESILLWSETWAQALAGVTGEQLKYGLELSMRTYLDFPPTLPQFKQSCLSMPKPYVALEAKQDWESTDGYAKECMAKISDVLAHPKKPGKWWAHAILKDQEAGRPVTATQVRFAKEAIYGSQTSK